MATINIANLTFSHKGNYDGSTAYVKNDVVYYATNGNAYIAKQNTTGNVPTNATYWSQFAQGSGGIWNGGLSLGSANQSLRVNSGANALEFYTPSGGGILQYKRADKIDTQLISSNNFGGTLINGLSVSITPSSASNKILVKVGLQFDTSNGYRSGGYIFRDGTKIGLGETHGSRQRLTFGLHCVPNQHASADQEILDAPNSTSSLTYTVGVGTEGNSGQIRINGALADTDNNTMGRLRSYITVMEISGGIL